MRKQGFGSLHQYFHFARNVGKKIDFNRRMNKLAKYYQVSIYHLGSTVEKQLYEGGPDDPVQMVLNYISLSENAYEDLTTEGIIAKHIRPTTKKSFFRYGDRNTLTSTISRHYINDADSTPLDIQAQNLSISFEREITTDDLIEFILTARRPGYENPKTYQSKAAQELEALEIAFKAATGITLNSDFALRFHQEFMHGGNDNWPVVNTAEKAPF